MMLGIVVATLAFCGCRRCVNCRLRDYSCIKALLRWCRHDTFCDFELMVLVHELVLKNKPRRMTTCVRVTAGLHTVQTECQSSGIFQQPLHILVEQGTESVDIDLVGANESRLATMKMDVVSDILDVETHTPEKVYKMRQMSKGAQQPKVKLTLVVSQIADEEEGLFSANDDLNMLLHQHMKKTVDLCNNSSQGKPVSEQEVLKQACTGPLELFGLGGLGVATGVLMSVRGPPTSRRWTLELVQELDNAESMTRFRKRLDKDIDITKIASVQEDPARDEVFVINYYDEFHMMQTLTFRRVDRHRDVWVKVLCLLCQVAHESHMAKKGRSKAKQDIKSSMERTLVTGEEAA